MEPDRKSCKATGDEVALLAACGATIVELNPYAHSLSVSLDEPEVSDGDKIKTIDAYYDPDGIPVAVYGVPKMETIFYHKHGDRSKRSTFKDAPYGILAKNVRNLRGLSVEWLNEILYFLDGNALHALDMTSGLSLILPLRLDEPRDIVVDLAGASLFVADCGVNPKIMKANLDGSDGRVLVGRKISWPSSLSVDFQGRRLYWSDLLIPAAWTMRPQPAPRHRASCACRSAAGSKRTVSRRLPALSETPRAAPVSGAYKSATAHSDIP